MCHVIANKDNINDNHRNVYTLDHLTHGHNSHEAVLENVETNEIEEMESVQKYRSLETDNITSIEQSLEQKKTFH